MRQTTHPRVRAALALAAVASVTLGGCGSAPSPTAGPSTASTVTTASTITRATTAPTTSTTPGLAQREPGPISVPDCAGGKASPRVALADGRLRQVDLSDAYVCLEDDGHARMVMPMPALPNTDSPTYVIDVRDNDGGLFLFALPEGYPRVGAVATTDRHPVAYVSSPNGRVLAVFDPQALQGPVVARFQLRGADGAVLATLDAAPGTNRATPGGPQPTLPADDAAVPATIASSLRRDPGPPYLGVIVNEAEAACIADGLVTELGIARVRGLAIGATAWPSLATGVGLTPAEAGTIADILQRCAEHWKRFAFLYATAGTGEMSEASAQCVERALTDAQARTFFVKERSGYQSIDHILPVEAAVDGCVTPAERERIDWN